MGAVHGRLPPFTPQLTRERDDRLSCTSSFHAHPGTGSSVMPNRVAAASTTAVRATCPSRDVRHSTVPSLRAPANRKVCRSATLDMSVRDDRRVDEPVLAPFLRFLAITAACVRVRRGG